MAEAVRERVCTVCPEWVMQCVHFDGKTLTLGGRMDCPDFFWRGFSVSQGLGFSKSRLCDCMLTNSDDTSYFPDLPAAQAEFLARAELLRQGSGDG